MLLSHLSCPKWHWSAHLWAVIASSASQTWKKTLPWNFIKIFTISHFKLDCNFTFHCNFTISLQQKKSQFHICIKKWNQLSHISSWWLPLLSSWSNLEKNFFLKSCPKKRDCNLVSHFVVRLYKESFSLLCHPNIPAQHPKLGQMQTMIADSVTPFYFHFL